MKTRQKITLRPQHFFALVACGVIVAMVLVVSLQLVVNYESRMPLSNDFSVSSVLGMSIVFSFVTVPCAVVASPFLLLYLTWFPVPKIYNAAIIGGLIAFALAQLHPALAMTNVSNIFDATWWASDTKSWFMPLWIIGSGAMTGALASGLLHWVSSAPQDQS